MNWKSIAAGVAMIAVATAVVAFFVTRRGRHNFDELGTDPYPSALDHHRNVPATLL